MYRGGSSSDLDLGNPGASSDNGHTYNQYLVQGNGNGVPPSDKPQRRTGKEWLPYTGQRQLIIAIDLGTWKATCLHVDAAEETDDMRENCNRYDIQWRKLLHPRAREATKD